MHAPLRPPPHSTSLMCSCFLCHCCPLFLSVSLPLQLSLSVSNFLCLTLFFLLSPVSTSSCFLSSRLPSYKFFLHLSQFFSLALFSQWLSAVTDGIQTRLMSCRLEAVNTQPHTLSLSLMFKYDYRSHKGNMHTCRDGFWKCFALRKILILHFHHTHTHTHIW